MAIKNAAVITHYYSGPGDVPDTSVEEALADLDSVGADVVEKLELGAALDDEEPLVLAVYVTMLRGRVPPARDGQQKVLETFGALQVEMALANASPAEQAEILAGAKADGTARPDEDFEAFADRLIAELRSGATKVVHHPLATMGAGRDRRQPRGADRRRDATDGRGGAGRRRVRDLRQPHLRLQSPNAELLGRRLTADVEVTMPLSTRRMLRFSHFDWFQGQCCLTEPAVDHFNSRTSLAAGDYLFASSKEALERVAALLDPETRRRPGGGVEISGYP